MSDKYRNFTELAFYERYMKDYIIEQQLIKSNILIFTPHGGGIEPGTTEIVKAIASDDINYYTMTAKKVTGNEDLHITSDNYDEPRLLNLLTTVDRCISIHGCADTNDVIYMGGLDYTLRSRIESLLKQNGFDVQIITEFLAESLSNITNKTKTNAGVQIEISRGLRNKFFDDITTAKGRSIKKELFWKFVLEVRNALEPYIFGLNNTSNIILN